VPGFRTVRERPAFTTTTKHFSCHRHIAISVVTHQRIVDMDQDSVARIPVDQYQSDHYKHAELKARRSIPYVCIP